MTGSDNRNLIQRRAIEALRNGVPNSDAVRLLGCNQPKAESHFNELAGEAANAAAPGESLNGMLVAGEFGTGKSHFLTHLQERALDLGFVCSKVTISKETPLFYPDRVFKAAVEGARVPGHKGRLVEELDLASKIDEPSYRQFFGWVAYEAEYRQLNGLFRACLVAYQESRDLDIKSRIEGFWGGDRIIATDVKKELRRLGRRDACVFRAPRLADLPPQRLRFMLEMIKGAGYKGWVLLLDEIELLSTYTPLQRGKAYAELARWMGLSKQDPFPGMVCVGAVTEDFAIATVSPDGKKKDWDYIPEKLRVRPRLEALAPLAEKGMSMLLKESFALDVPTPSELRDSLERVRQLYSDAYAWNAPEIELSGHSVGFQRRMRYKVRSAINQWDLQRLDPTARPETVSDDSWHYSPSLDGDVPDGPGDEAWEPRSGALD